MKPLIWEIEVDTTPEASVSAIVDIFRLHPDLLGNKKPADQVRGSSGNQRASERGPEVVSSGKSGAAAAHRPSSNKIIPFKPRSCQTKKECAA